MTATDFYLQNNLKKFGLNPLDWKLRKLRERKYKIANIHDDNFYFVGEADVQKSMPTWNQIILASF